MPPCCLSQRHGQIAKFAEVSDVYRTVLGPTSDETILAGLQTVMELCLSPKQRSGDSHSEYSMASNYSSRSTSIISNNEKSWRSTACMTEKQCDLRCISVLVAGYL